MVASNINKAYRIEITKKIIEALKNGTAPWQKPWEGDYMPAFKHSLEYAREELIAEISSVFLCAEFGIAQTQEHFDNHASYVASWINILDKDYNAIFRASSEAERITEFILKFSPKNNQ